MWSLGGKTNAGDSVWWPTRSLERFQLSPSRSVSPRVSSVDARADLKGIAGLLADSSPPSPPTSQKGWQVLRAWFNRPLGLTAPCSYMAVGHLFTPRHIRRCISPVLSELALFSCSLPADQLCSGSFLYAKATSLPRPLCTGLTGCCVFNGGASRCIGWMLWAAFQRGRPLICVVESALDSFSLESVWARQIHPSLCSLVGLKDGFPPH